MKRFLPILVLAALVPAQAAQAKPALCTKHGVAEALKSAGKDVLAGVWQHQCGDVNGDGQKDVVYTLLSGGTAGTTRFGVITADGLLTYKEGYKVAVDRVSSTRFDVEQPYYRESDANCCPSAFDVTPYRFRNGAFKAGKSKRNKKPQKRFQSQT